MAAGKYDITIEQGADFVEVWTWKDENGSPVNLTGYSARMMVRKKVEDASPILDCTTANNRIVLGGTAGTITFAVPASVTALLPTVANAVYDLELVDGAGRVRRLVEGECRITREVTR